MKQISLRQFANQPSKYIKELPFTLTQYNKPVATVIPYKGVILQPDYDSVKLPVATGPAAPIYNSTPQESKHELNPLTGRPLSGVKKNCPICNESSPIELATKHYMEKHGDI